MKKQYVPAVITLPERVTQGKLALLVGINQGYLSLILHGYRRCKAPLARKLARACERLAIELTIYDWLFPEESTSPLIQKLN